MMKQETPDRSPEQPAPLDKGDPKQVGVVPVVGIGASAGGLKALEQFFKNLPSDLGMAFVIVQHLAPDYKSELTALIQRYTQMQVMQITHGAVVQPNCVYVIPPGKLLAIGQGVLLLSDLIHQQSRRTPISLFFSSLAADLHERAIAIILSGTGTDGTQGLKAIKEQAGVTMAQTPDDAEYDGMPRSAIAAGIVDVVATAHELAYRLVGYQHNVARIQLPAVEEALAEDQTPLLLRILTQLREKTGYDFSQYKHSTILRRIGRRMRIQNIENMTGYLARLCEEPNEAQALFRDFLISVTNFFRDAKSFQFLEKKILPHLFEGKGAHQQIRVWVPGCATGEEAYSLAILLTEQAALLPAPPDIQIFATDIDKEALSYAQEGLYTEAIAADVSPERLYRFFTNRASGYQVKKEIREKVLFAAHNLITDPPFSRLDLISCRNLLIYLDRELQERVFHFFHYALRPHGYLFLGSSESTDVVAPMFKATDKKHRIFQRQESLASQPRLPIGVLRWRRELDAPGPENKATTPPTLREKYQAWRLKRYAPPSLLVTETYDIAYVFGEAGSYLQIKEGPASLNVLEAVVPALRLELRAALYEAQQKGEHTLSAPVRLTLGSETRVVRLAVGPIEEESFPRDLVEVVFWEQHEVVLTDSGALLPDGPPNAVAERLEQELMRTKARLQTVVEEFEASTEELQASNEELQSMNEELQSTTEELETSKEELQSVNQELIIVNQEIKAKIEELSYAYGDLENLMASTEIGTLFLDRELRLKRFTRSVEAIVHILPPDVGRPFAHLTHDLYYNHLADDARQVLKRLTPIAYEVQSKAGEWYMVRILPYRTPEDKIDGVVITFVQITQLKETEQLLARRERQQAAVAALGRMALEGADKQLLLQVAADQVCEVLEREFCEVLTLQANGNTLVLTIGIGWPDGIVAQTTLRLTQDEQSRFLLARAEPTIMTELSAERRFRPSPHVLAQGIVSGLSVTIPGLERPYGIFSVYSKHPHPFAQEDVDFLQTVANLLAEAIERRRAEHELRALKDELEQRVLERTAELEQSNQELNRFAYIASHDLKAPLRAISNLGNWVVEDVGEQLPAASREHLNKLLVRVERMEQLLNDLLLYSRAGRFRHQPEMIDTALLLQELLHLLAVPPRFQITVTAPMPVLYAERVPLELVLRNLLSNAIKHHDRTDGHIQIAAQEVERTVEFSVQDDGPGIDPQHHERIFGMFEKLRSHDEVEGSGMGLAVVKRTVESRGGSVMVESTPGAGAIFRFTWPKQEAQSRADNTKR